MEVLSALSVAAHIVAPPSSQPQDYAAVSSCHEEEFSRPLDKDVATKMVTPDATMGRITSATTTEVSSSPEPLEEPSSSAAMAKVMTEERVSSMLCQICLTTSVEMSTLVTHVCGDEQCASCVCHTCLVRHVEVALSNCYRGLVPRVKCPICLGPFSIHQLQRLVNDLDQEIVQKVELLHEQMEEFAKRALAVTAPCCHNTEYSHLPDYEPDTQSLEPLPPQDIELIVQTLEQFENYKLDARTVADTLIRIMDTAEISSAFLDDMLHNMLAHVKDPERRATLHVVFEPTAQLLDDLL